MSQSDPSSVPAVEPSPAAGAEQTVTRINRGWLIKMVIYLVAMTALGVWGLVDGIWIYPKRGHESASFREKEYLEQAQKAGKLLTAAVTDPRAERSRLNAAERQLRQEAEKGTGQAALDAAAELARLDWLTALSRVGWLAPEHAKMGGDPVKRLGELQAQWANKNPPKPLSAYDIPAQWVICAGGLGAGGWILLLVTRVSTKKYRFDPGSLRLTLPDGRTVVPGDIAEVDKRKWDKYFVTFVLKGGKGSMTLDLLRYSPLEAWVLEMEKKTDGYVPPPAGEAPTKTDTGVEPEAAKA